MSWRKSCYEGHVFGIVGDQLILPLKLYFEQYAMTDLWLAITWKATT